MLNNMTDDDVHLACYNKPIITVQWTMFMKDKFKPAGANACVMSLSKWTPAVQIRFSCWHSHCDQRSCWVAKSVYQLSVWCASGTCSGLDKAHMSDASWHSKCACSSIEHTTSTLHSCKLYWLLLIDKDIVSSHGSISRGPSIHLRRP